MTRKKGKISKVYRYLILFFGAMMFTLSSLYVSLSLGIQGAMSWIFLVKASNFQAPNAFDRGY